MRVTRFATAFSVSVIGVFALAMVCASPALAQDDHAHGLTAPQPESNSEQKGKAGALVKLVREVTERFKNVAVAESEDYHLLFGCVSGPDSGAMGLHYVNFPKVIDGKIDAADPEIVIYEPIGNGKVKLIGADYLVLADAWNATHSSAPEMMGQLFHLFEAPNRFGLPAFYTLHVWAWKDSPAGTFVNWHPNVSCDAFTPQQN
jgi:hypothetical protein